MGDAARESEPCTRDTDGATCADPECAAFGDCEFEGHELCDETGTKPRVCTPRVCKDGACDNGAPHDDTEACTRETDGVVCVARVCGAWGTCAYAAECDEIQSQTRSCTETLCAGEACNSGQAPTERQDCVTTRVTDGSYCDYQTPHPACPFGDPGYGCCTSNGATANNTCNNSVACQCI